MHNNDTMKQDACSICLDGFDENQSLKEIHECKHLYHAVCISSWIKQKISDPFCPMCKRKL